DGLLAAFAIRVAHGDIEDHAAAVDLLAGGRQPGSGRFETPVERIVVEGEVADPRLGRRRVGARWRGRQREAKTGENQRGQAAPRTVADAHARHAPKPGAS